MRVGVSPETVREVLAGLGPTESLKESQAAVAEGKMPPEMIQAMCLKPGFLSSFEAMGRSIYPGGLVDQRTKELIIITVSQENSCSF